MIPRIILLAAIAILIPACGGSDDDSPSGPVTPPYPNVFATDIRLDSGVLGAASSTDPQMAAVGNTVYAVWSDTRDGQADIYLGISTTFGSSWSAVDTRLDSGVAGAFASTKPVIAAVGTNVYVAWSDNRSGQTDIYFNRSSDSGVTWLVSDVRLDSGTAGAFASTSPQIACEGTDVFVAWEDARSGATDVYVSASADSGMTWTVSNTRIDSGTAGAFTSTGIRMAQFGTEVCVVWQDNRGGTWDIYSNRTLNSGVAWLPTDIRVDAGGSGDATVPDVARVGGNVYVAWQDSRNVLTDVYSRKSADSGTTWPGTEFRLDISDPPGLTESEVPTIAATGSNVYVAWSDKRNGGRDIYFNRSDDFGVTFQVNDTRIEKFGPGVGDSNFPEICCSGTYIYVAWQDRRLTMADIYLNYSSTSGVEWSPFDYRLDKSPADTSDSLKPQVVCSGNVFVSVWQDLRNGSADIYSNRANP